MNSEHMCIHQQHFYASFGSQTERKFSCLPIFYLLFRWSNKNEYNW